MNELIIMRRDRPSDLLTLSAITRAERESGSRFILISDGALLESLIGFESPDIRLDLISLTGLESALLITHLATQDIADCIIVNGVTAQIERYLDRLRWVLARLNARCMILVDGPLTSTSQ